MSLQELAIQNSPQMSGVNSLINTIKSATNPADMITQMANSNPMIQQAQQVAKQYGGYEQAVKAIAQQRGIDLQSIFNQLRG